MRIIDIKEQPKPISSSIRNAFIDFSKMDCSVVAIITDVIKDGKPVVGYGFNSNGRYAPTGIIHRRLIPRILAAKPEDYVTEDGKNLDPFKLWKIMLTNEKPGGHGDRAVAVGTIDMAIWDAVAKIEEKPLYQLLSERYGDGKPDKKVFVYAAGGYYQPGKDDTKLQDELKGYLDMGYNTVKMKIGNGIKEDERRIKAALKVVPDGHLAVDANGRLNLEEAIEYGKMLSNYPLFWYEEPGDPLDYQLQNELEKHYQGTMATGENLLSMQDARNLIRYGGMDKNKDYLQFDCALSYGLVEYFKTLKMLKDYGWSTRRVIPHGGHQLSLNIAAGLHLGGNESYPGIFQPFGGFADNEPIENGYVKLPNVPGIGFETKSKLMPVLESVANS